MGRIELVLAAVLAFLAGLSIGACINRAAPTPAPTRLIAPLDLTRSPSPAANRDLHRPWLPSTAPPSETEGVTPAVTIPAVGHWRPAAATEHPSPSALPRHSATTQRPAAVTPPAAAGPSAEQWAILRHCESGGDYGQRANPNYRGGYQIGFREWREYGGTGYDPADATPAEQDAVALRLWQARGWEPWAASSGCTGLR